MRQWFLRITAYADELLRGLEELDWPDSAKRVQREWIGRSEGTEIEFRVAGKDVRLQTFTTRPDTLFGVTFLALPPEHPYLESLAGGTDQEGAVRAYVDEALRRRLGAPGRAPRTPSTPERTGAFTGAFAIHPATGDEVPIYVGDHVVAAYGTGAVMGVPAHDVRDFAFA